MQDTNATPELLPDFENHAERQVCGEDVNTDLNDDEADLMALAEEVFESDELAQEAAAELSEDDGEEAEAGEAEEEKSDD